jgi:hypothetical protein
MSDLETDKLQEILFTRDESLFYQAQMKKDGSKKWDVLNYGLLPVVSLSEAVWKFNQYLKDLKPGDQIRIVKMSKYLTSGALSISSVYRFQEKK